MVMNGRDLVHVSFGPLRSIPLGKAAKRRMRNHWVADFPRDADAYGRAIAIGARVHGPIMAVQWHPHGATSPAASSADACCTASMIFT